jgi:carbonic anhydrase
MNDPELNAMEKIHEAMSTLSAADQRKVARWSLPTTDVEVKAQTAVLGAVEPLKEPQRVRIISWAFNPKTGRFSGPTAAKPGRPKAKDRTIDLRTAV